MKRFAAVAVLGLGLFVAGNVEAGKLPKGEAMVGRMKVWRPAHSTTNAKPPQGNRGVEKMKQWRPAHPQQ